MSVRSCFYRTIPTKSGASPHKLALDFKEDAKPFDPQAVYGDAPNPTKL